MRNVNSKPHGFTAAGKVTEFRAWPIERADQTLPQRPPGLVYPVGFNSPETMGDVRDWKTYLGPKKSGGGSIGSILYEWVMGLAIQYATQ